MTADGHSDGRGSGWPLSRQRNFLYTCVSGELTDNAHRCRNSVFLRKVCMIVRKRVAGNAKDLPSDIFVTKDVYLDLICALTCNADSCSNSHI